MYTHPGGAERDMYTHAGRAESDNQRDMYTHPGRAESDHQISAAAGYGRGSEYSGNLRSQSSQYCALEPSELYRVQRDDVHHHEFGPVNSQGQYLHQRPQIASLAPNFHHNIPVPSPLAPPLLRPYSQTFPLVVPSSLPRHYTTGLMAPSVQYRQSHMREPIHTRGQAADLGHSEPPYYVDNLNCNKSGNNIGRNNGRNSSRISTCSGARIHRLDSGNSHQTRPDTRTSEQEKGKGKGREQGQYRASAMTPKLFRDHFSCDGHYDEDKGSIKRESERPCR